MTNSIRIHSTIVAAQTICPLGERVVSASWKQTTNQDRKERAIILPIAVLLAPEVPDSFRPLVEAVLLSSAEQTLKDFVTQNPNSYEVLPAVFSREQLIENYLSTADNWMNRETLEKSFVAGATWKRITSREEFKSNATYQANANAFKEAILRLAAKPTHIPAAQRDVILAKLDESDITSEFGGFILRRFDQMAKKDSKVTEISFDML